MVVARSNGGGRSVETVMLLARPHGRAMPTITRVSTPDRSPLMPHVPHPRHRRAPLAIGVLVATGLITSAAGPVAAVPAEPGAGPAPARFATATTAELGGVFPGGPAVADFTGDGKPDVAVAMASFQPGSGVVVSVGNGRGDFTDRIDTALPGDANACDVAAGDLNRDGNVDLAVSTCESGASPVLLLIGKGNGTFDVAQTLLVGSSLSHPAIGLLDGDT